MRARSRPIDHTGDAAEPCGCEAISEGSASVLQELANRGIVVKAESMDTVLEGIPEAYKDVAEVVEVVSGAGIARKVARLTPIGVING